MSPRSIRIYLTSLLAFCLVAAAAAPARVQGGLEPLFTMPPGDNETSEAVDETPQRWFVELSGRPETDGGDRAALQNEKKAFRDAARAAGVQYTERYAFGKLWNGFSVSATSSQLSAIRSIPGVVAVYGVEQIALPSPSFDSSPDMMTALAMTGANVAQNSLGLTGAGVKVAVMDTGIDIDHPDFAGNGTDDSTPFPTSRVVTGHDFVGDNYNSSGTGAQLTPVPDNNPDDCGGHGTHVAGIVGANGTVKGVAPGVSFGAYRVFGCSGTTDSDIMIAAMERALDDDMDILNMSIGAAFQWPQYPTAVAADRLVKQGVVVVASIGNSGTSGLYAAGAPGVGSKVIGVANFQNSHINSTAFTITPDNAAIGYLQATAAPAAPTSGTFPMTRTGTASSAADACSALPAGSLAGRVALIRRGTCGFNIKANNAQLAGAVGVVIYNNVPGIQNITVAGPPNINIPVVSVDMANGVLINNRLASGPVSMTWTNQVGSTPNVTGNIIDGSSSYGLAADLSMKPDIGAPGGLIRSTYPLELGGFAILSGTSMASPHVAGAAALLLQARPGTRAEDVAGILQNTASPRQSFASAAFVEAVHRQGAGMLQIDKAILSTTSVAPSELALGESEFGPATRTVTVANNGSSPVTYDLSHRAATATGPNTFVVSILNAPSAVSFSAPSVTVAPGSTATFDVTIAPNAGLSDRSLYGGYVVLTPQGGGQTYSVPFAGIKGDYQSFTVLAPTANNFPWLAKRTGTTYFNQPGGATYTLQNGDIPYFLAHLDHHSRRAVFEIRDANTNELVHPVFHNAIEDEYLARNSSATSFFAFAWDGTRIHSNGGKGKTKVVPNGQYRITLRVLKALGDENNPAHTETWTSPVITIARP
ncbi:MAG TPA: S8 family serine peptidase [Pyrinomonadaceae bacterium]|nr:S8 family serine peptidase [Pyrinomonadaceae bacterium]